MIPFNELLLFIVAALVLVLSPGPNMIYLISRSITQGRIAGLTSLFGVICGFLFHIVLVSFGLTALLLAVPFAFQTLKLIGVGYLLYLAYQSIKPNSKSIFESTNSLPKDKPGKLILTGFLTNVLNPKVAIFYLSFFPQFIKPEYGSILLQNLELGITQVIISFFINFLIVLSAARVFFFFSKNRTWLKVQKWFMAGVLTMLALKMATSRAK